jgi:DNA polymerase V
MIALIDCNNFFVSCERTFQPDLQNKPTIVMSSNDGCVIARSQEVKDIGVPMGIPIFKIKDWIKQYDIQLRSTNFALYRDMSRRVMDVIKSMTDTCQVYSIDEAFFEILDGENAFLFSKKIQEKIMACTGIPTSVGVAQTKTLAKLANKRAKKSASHVYVISSERQRKTLLKRTSVGEIWGIGRGFSERLMDEGIRDAYALSVADDSRIESIFGMHGLHSAYELRGIRCMDIEPESQPRKSMISSRSFGKAISSRKELWNSVAYHVNALAEELREEQQVTQRIRVGLYVHRFKEDRRNSGSDERFLLNPTSDTKTLLREALSIFDQVYVPGRQYSKSGVTLTALRSEDVPVQETLFGVPAAEAKSSGVDSLMDSLNEKHGRGKVLLAEMLNPSRDRSWRPKSDLRSREFTTSWDQILEIGSVS